MNSRQRHTLTLTLKDGRKLGYAEYGMPHGFPIMLFHGTPGCRRWFREDDKVAFALGLRLIALDRPGFGLSDPKPGRTILDWPNDVAEAAEQLGLEKFSVLGISGGGVYAAACAYSIPHKLAAVALVSTIAPFEKGKIPQRMCLPNKAAFFLSRHFPWLLKRSYKYQKSLIEKEPARFIDTLQKQLSHLCEQDRKVMQSVENAQVVMLQLEGALQHSVNEAASEPALLSRDWGFNCAHISMPVQIWHGTEDTLAPLEEIKKLAAMLSSCSTHYIEGAGHFITEDKAIWTNILMNLVK